MRLCAVRLFITTETRMDTPRLNALVEETCMNAWPALKEKLIAVFKSKTRAEWCAIMEGTDICFAPVLTMADAPQHPHMAARNVFVERHGVTQPAPAPRFSRTESAIREPVTAEIRDLIGAWRKS